MRRWRGLGQLIEDEHDPRNPLVKREKFELVERQCPSDHRIFEAQLCINTWASTSIGSCVIVSFPLATERDPVNPFRIFL